MRRLKWRVEAAAFDVFAWLLRALPLDVASAMGGQLARMLGPLTSRHKVVELNLRLAFPEFTPEARRAIAMDFWDNFGRTGAEFVLMDQFRPGSSRVEIVGEERMRELAKSKMPAVLFSGHFANFEVMVATALSFGAPGCVVYRPANNPYTEKRIQRMRRGYGEAVFAAKGRDSRQLLSTLKKGGWVGILSDQRDDNGLSVPFFGHLVKVSPGPARLAMSFGRDRLFPVSVVRTRGANFRVTFHEPIHLQRTGDADRDVELGTAQVSSFFEQTIRENPAQWLWSHRRWPLSAYGALNRKGRI